ncbi:hypothetical protein HCJ66_09095 [Listeria sp. FSL L7-1582]|uniref:Two component regulator three Y domain-containing protein n=1 Tax=Listeria rustica TaxID=2713503 RepID=A0A7W1YGL5_9LIST|nr:MULTISPECIES: hypothetical protein [Listeria]MBA3926763.1 hypothetical protein [Listeria rustica]MBC6309714.1 hypothetical protein [Listeria portnoyi]
METQTVIQNVEVFFTDDFLEAKVMLESPQEDLVYAFYVYKVGTAEAIFKSAYKKFDTHRLEVTEPGAYKVKAFVKNVKTKQTVAQTSKAVQKTVVKEY